MIIAMNPIASIQLLGGLKVHCGEQTWTRFRTQKAGELLAYLAYYCHKAHSREHLITLLWEDVPLETGRNRLNVTLYVLRSQFKTSMTASDDFFSADRNSVQLNTEFFAVDTAEFKAHLAEVARTHDTPSRLSSLKKACALYRGELLPDFCTDWIGIEQARFSAHFVQALRQLAGCYETLGDLNNAQDAFRRAAQEEPLNEEICRELMRLAVCKGEPAAALQQFQNLERHLREQLSLPPSAETQHFVETLQANGAKSEPKLLLGRSGITLPEPLPRSDEECPPVVLPQPIPEEHIPSPAFPAPSRKRVSWRLPSAVIGALCLCLAVLRFSEVKRNAPVPAYQGRQIWQVSARPLADEKSLTPVTLTTDRGGSLYVTGVSQTAQHDADILTLKFAPDGSETWRHRFNGLNNDCDRPSALTVDAEGNVYVAGESYNGDREQGKTQWDTTLLKYAPDGTQLWLRHFNERPNNDDHALRVATDAAGFVYVGGWSEDARKHRHFLLLKYDADGELLWTRSYLPPAAPGNPLESQLSDMAVDAAGNISLTGTGRFQETNDAPFPCALTLRYDHNGNLIWQRKFSGDTHGTDKAYSVALAPMGGIYVGGSGYLHKVPFQQNSEVFFVIRYDAQGSEQWVTQTQAGAFPNILYRLSVDTSGNCLVSGIGGSVDRALLKFQSDGKRNWTEMESPQIRKWETHCIGLQTDRDSNSFVAATEADPAATELLWQLVLDKFAPDGTVLWKRQLSGMVFPTAEGNLLAVDDTGNVFVAAQVAEGLTVWKISP